MFCFEAFLANLLTAGANKLSICVCDERICYNIIWGPNRVFGKTEDHSFLSVKKVKTHFLVK